MYSVKRHLIIFLAALVVGTVVEIIASVLNLWVYSPRFLVVLNVTLLFGIIMSSIAALLRSRHAILSYIVGFVVGYGYEWINVALLHWWHFPDNRLLCFHGVPTIAFVVALGWGTVALGLRLIWRA
jgi:hypothetical protein